MSKKFQFTTRQRYRYVYEVVPDKLGADELDNVASFGIRITMEGDQIDYVSNVSADREDVEALVRLCNKEKLDPIHLKDVVADFKKETAFIQ